jgi:hypothetical protein
MSFVLFIVVIVLSVLRPFLLWALHCLSFVLFIVVIVLSVVRPFYCGHCIVWDNAMTTIKRTKDRQYNDHNKKDEGQTIQWPQLKGWRTDNTMTTIKRTKDTMVLSVLRPFHCGHCIVCPSSFLLWSLYCLSFVLFIADIVLSVLRPFHCGQCIVCPSSFLLWSLHCQWPQWNGRRTENTMITIKRTKDRRYNDHNKKDEGYTIPFYCGHCIVCPSSFLL